jgi:hypothetical protein
MGTGFGSLAKYSADDFVLGGLTGILRLDLLADACN